ncbi:uncharacterized protein LOC121945051 isoform X2 [Plectropomus leopardus]|uniref:uncharacterized protein LOC121945051 isoform X2 n=1 Tax=Plectropomus leopardus TaxID=160734 RepID=UPI001C4CFF7C|nr:uncharacterized protein LOC121945051 isoform X2 [Plectropomus leopardus]
MGYPITSLLLLHAADFILSFPVTGSQGCATDVTHVFCNNELVFNNSHIAQCTGPPPPNTVCQNDGRAFVSTDTDGDCEFEGDARIETLKCTDQSDICVFIIATTPSPVTAPPQVTTEGPQNDKRGHIAGGVFGALLLLLIIGSLLNICVKRYQNQPPASDSGETENLRAMQSSGDTSNSDTQGGPGLDDDSSPHRDRGV